MEFILECQCLKVVYNKLVNFLSFYMNDEKIIVIIEGYKFDLTEYANSHPGGVKLLKKFHNKDATEEFNRIKGHSDGYALGLMEKYCLGPVEENGN